MVETCEYPVVSSPTADGYIKVATVSNLTLVQPIKNRNYTEGRLTKIVHRDDGRLDIYKTVKQYN